MFKHLLLPTDGSKLAARGFKGGVKLAAALGAKVTGVYVIMPYTPPVYGEAAVYYIPGTSPEEYRETSEKNARKALAAIEIEAQTAKVRCSTRFVTSGRPYEAIVKAAGAAKCDAIVMSTHGRGGLSGLILGSETQRVLAHAKVPVIVIR